VVKQVIDFVSVGNFAVFNVADSCITVGVGVLLLGVWLQEKREKKLKVETTPDETAPEKTDKTES
jgi:signal peptidase II